MSFKKQKKILSYLEIFFIFLLVIILKNKYGFCL